MHGENGYSNNDPMNAARRVAQLHRKIEENRGEIVMTGSFDTADCEVLIIAAGAVARAARAAAFEARRKGIKAGVLQLITIWPFPDREIMEYAKNARAIVVAEMNYGGQLAGEVTKALGSGISLKKVNSYNGQIITPSQILKELD
jgi:2-oxoglutarate ferredoxin oxidoreductase subunit alpha